FPDLPRKLAAHIRIDQVVFRLVQPRHESVIRDAQLIETLSLLLRQAAEEVFDHHSVVIAWERQDILSLVKTKSVEMCHFSKQPLRQASTLLRIRQARIVNAFIVNPSRSASARRRSIFSRRSPW